jgi:hypothetical protein
MPELSFTVTGAPMISLKNPLGSLESPAASGAGLSPLVDMMALGKLTGRRTFSEQMRMWKRMVVYDAYLKNLVVLNRWCYAEMT